MCHNIHGHLIKAIPALNPLPLFLIHQDKNKLSLKISHLKLEKKKKSSSHLSSIVQICLIKLKWLLFRNFSSATRHLTQNATKVPVAPPVQPWKSHERSKWVFVHADHAANRHANNRQTIGPNWTVTA